MASTNTAVEIGKSAISAAAVLANSKSKSSIFRLTKDQVFQFPIIMDADIDDDEKLPLIKGLEKMYAELVMVAIVNEGMVDRDKYSNINQFLKMFHNNTDLPGLDSDDIKSIRGAFGVTEAFIPAEVNANVVSEKDLRDMWNNVEESLDTSSINDIYLPYKQTAAKLQASLDRAHESFALEASGGKEFFRVPDPQMTDSTTKTFDAKTGKLIGEVKTSKIEKDGQGNNVFKGGKDGSMAYRFIEAPDKNTQQYKEYVDKYGEPKTQNEWEAINKKERDEFTKEEQSRMAALAKNNGTMMREDSKYGAMSPTILQLTITNTKTGGGNWAQQLIIGIRAMPRMVAQSVMIANMIEAFQDRPIFKFIQWTKGEIKFAEVFTGLDEARKSVKTRWLNTLRKRAKRNATMSWFGKKLNPNTTIIITEADAYTVKEKGFVDPHNVSDVKKMMSKYALLAFGIYDAEAKMLNIMYDGDDDFTTQSLRAMVAESKKDTNLLDMNR